MPVREDRIEEGFGHRWIVTKTGTRISFYNAESQAKGGLTTLWRSLARMAKLARTDDDGYEWKLIEWKLDEIETLLHVWREEVRKHSVRTDVQGRIAHLRNVQGRTPDEAAAYLAKADELERTLTR